ncbi:PspC domain-containing protein [uncultured Rikenella sp.]|uniref:PspC domain-containing protein n=1 Tax=uncultured Rikenella sp. TaxID=368003 RepID=UPI00272B53DB|nr:PspC domain-containing protein [uncultured Rikenella sp.]
MEKILTINLDSRSFMMDEAAYNTLSDYLHQIEMRLERPEEITDIERRLADILTELNPGVVDTDTVRVAMDRLGSPDRFGSLKPDTASAPNEPKRLYRSRKNRMIAGVCGGLAEYFGIDPIIIRLIALVLLFGGGGFLLYVIGWIIIPQRPLSFTTKQSNR